MSATIQENAIQETEIREAAADGEIKVATRNRGEGVVCSMTGFAGASCVVGLPRSGEMRLQIALKSVNHRFLDLQLRLPSGFDALEMELRRMLKDEFVRGHIEFNLSLDRSSQRAPTLNTAALEACLESFRSAARQFALETQPDLNMLLRLPGILQQDSGISEQDQSVLCAFVLEQTRRLIPTLRSMRAREGDELTRVLRDAMAMMEDVVCRLERLQPEITARHEQRLQLKIESLIGSEVNRQRLLEEVALLADRSDVSEELARLRTHIRHFLDLLTLGGEVGKKLDFLLQELNREANTLLSKTTGVAGKGTEVTELGLALKAGIEKVREQIQNLE